MDIKRGTYYLVKSKGVLGCAIVRAGKDIDGIEFVAYLGRCRTKVRYSDVVREADKSEANSRNARKLYHEVFGN